MPCSRPRLYFSIDFIGLVTLLYYLNFKLTNHAADYFIEDDINQNNAVLQHTKRAGLCETAQSETKNIVLPLSIYL